MKYTRNVNGFAVDTRTDSPEGFFTDDIVAQFVPVTDDVMDGWQLIGDVWSAPVPYVPTPEEIAAKAAADAAIAELNRIEILKEQISEIEDANPITVRELRELALIVRQIILTIAPSHPPVYGLEVANTIDTEIAAIRAQI